jgi:hypothetical protein
MSIRNILIFSIILSVFAIGAVSAISVPHDTIELIEDNGYELVDDDDTSVVYEFEKGSDKITILFMFDYEISLDDLEDGFEEKEINNTDGFYKEKDGNYLFHYACGEDSVLITATDRDIIDKIVLGNDP